jgi:LmbE family N-acetylglucosaminyl deacetylase
MAERRTILTVHAHPDDEASKGAPTLARYHAEGAYTVLVCCTGGRRATSRTRPCANPVSCSTGSSPSRRRQLLVRLRPAELAASAAVIGFDEVVMLGYRDSGMPDSPANLHPDCFFQADLDEATGRLVEVIRRTKPQVIITYNDDQQGYPHPDHLRVHDISVLAFDRAGDPAWYPELGEPFTPSKLYYTTWSRAASWRSTKACSTTTASRPSTRLVRTARPRPPDHHQDRRVAVHLGAHQVAAGPRHPGRPQRALLVRPRRRSARHHLPLGGLDPRPVPGGPTAPPDSEHDLFDGIPLDGDGNGS